MALIRMSGGVALLRMSWSKGSGINKNVWGSGIAKNDLEQGEWHC